MKQQEPMNVTDSSQPIKIVLGVIALLVFGALGLLQVSLLREIVSKDSVAPNVTVNSPLGAGGNPINTGDSPNKFGLNTLAVVTSTVAIKLAAKSDAQYRECTNVGSSTVYWSATTTGLTKDTGGVITGSSTKVWSGDSLYTGDIYALTANASVTSTLSCTQI